MPPPINKPTQPYRITVKRSNMKDTPSALMTFIIVKSESKHYHIYNAVGDCVAILSSRLEVTNYINEVFCPSSFTSYTITYTAAAGTFIVTMK